MIPIWYSILYVPRGKLVELYCDNWAGWCANPPHWFDDDFKALVPRELLVGVDEKLLG